MQIKKRKSPSQVAQLRMLLNRLRGLDEELFTCGEPMLSTRLGAMVTDLQIVLDNTEEVQNGRTG